MRSRRDGQWAISHDGRHLAVPRGLGTSECVALARFKLSWESFVTSLVREWKTLNVSALLLS